MEKITVFRINVATRELDRVEVNPDGLADIYAAIGNDCDYVENIGINLPDGDSMLVDEDGRSKTGHAGVFVVRDRPETFLGNGIIVGRDEDGNMTTPKIKHIDMVKRIMYGEYKNA